MPRGYLKNKSNLIGLKKARGGSGRRNEKRKPFQDRHNREKNIHNVNSPRRYQKSKQLLWDANDLDHHLDHDDSEIEIYCEFTHDLQNCHEECLEHDLSVQSSTSLVNSLDIHACQYSMLDVPQPSTSAASLSSSSWCHSMSLASSCTSWNIVDDKEDSEVVTQVEAILDFVENKWNTNDPEHGTPQCRSSPSENDQCCICLEHKPLLKLMKRCQHPSACHDCLRQHYIINIDISDYPLKCFHHTCNRSVHDEQIQRLLKDEELQQHYLRRNLVRAKRKGVSVVKCPNCATFRSVYATDAKRNVVSCDACHAQFRLRGEEMVETREVLNLYYRCARCPSCNMIIFKSGGCYHMTCFCGHAFDWRKARRLLVTDMLELVQGVETDELVEVLKLHRQDRVRCPRCRKIISEEMMGSNAMGSSVMGSSMTCGCGHEFFWWPARKLFVAEMRLTAEVLSLPLAIKEF